ncbi:bifunctional phosphopantothenoylcysteine decarboxylase/phosphopantothenate--cysteine ligase CoaBC [Prochlorococcus marinus XMU1403]|uniref:bifunctional phosphopantothenoylcysteine decarboxylase/phosphopantothenate--cysteine ligase CoaBC n=1 Tax=Prochlorococcus marinus TaxID=1219 RepID=UPI000D980A70|nr:bifunctional phosphopantothenoylcysteine decarboxylase/phosphopantothenate--cysteine ligase CoaBC [Prochlorococcus marinus]MBW3048733.1 bifunctional phosphopantothenoylcysteine decarboxylase/phosphopantothenate--cysteine ligase CoaBC [Prochlorococcus marinus str. MU1403]PYE03304.1 bifunctional phosphopantothenoylcysteine decarboxylase/phosphopantothenate--cysteine ligase CoaBC [Prochlorococcus marinus XMU1403]
MINSTSLSGKKILVAVTGSIAAVKAPILVSRLIKAGAEVKCVITQSATNLVSPLSLSTLSRNKCYQDKDQWADSQTKPLHIALAEWAELIIVAPLSATSLSKFTSGSGDGLLASILLASQSQIVMAAAMNTSMWENQSVKENWNYVKTIDQVITLEPSAGLLACDRVGDGKMVNLDIIEMASESAFIFHAKNKFLTKDLKDIRFLISAGPTVEALDAARQLTNRSSGKMGVFIAQAAKLRGAEVDLVHGPVSVQQDLLEGLNTYPVRSSNEMGAKIDDLQPSAQVIVMAAAVSDFKNNSPSEQKISKEFFLKSIFDDLEMTSDLIKNQTKKKLENQIFLGFAAETGSDNEIIEKGEKKRVSKGCDLLMANPIDRSGQGFDENFNSGFLLGPKKMVKNLSFSTKLAISHQLLDEIRNLK